MKRHPENLVFIAALASVARGNLAVVSLAMIGASLVLATASEAASGRYQMTPVENGFMRLDTETGAVSICKTNDDKVVCELAEDGAGRYSKNIETLKQENQTLRAEVDRLERHFGLGPDGRSDRRSGSNSGTEPNSGPGIGPGREGQPNDLVPPVPPGTAFKVPQKEDVDQMFNYIEGMLNKFRERLQRLEKKPNPETPL